MSLNPQPVVFAAVNVSSQKLLDRIPHLAWLMSELGTILATNQLWSEYIGRSRADEARLGASSDRPVSDNAAPKPKSCNCCQTFLDLLDEGERDRFARVWAAASAAQEPLAINLRLMGTCSEWEWFQVELEPDRDRSGAITWIGTAQRLGGAADEAIGRRFWEVIVTPILPADGQVEQILSVSRDITDRQLAVSALQASEEMFRHTFEYTPIGFAHVLLDGRLSRVNHKFCEIVGYSPAELLTLTFHDITEPADLAEDLALVDRLLKDEIQEYTLEKRYIHKHGHHVWVSLTVSLVRSVAAEGQLGTPSYFLSAVQDITHRKQLEIINHHQTTELQQLNSSLLLTQQQLKDRNEDLDNFVRVASHDLKAPLRAIANLADWIEEDLSDRLNAGENQQFQLLRQRVNRMNTLIDGLLRYSRLGRQELEIDIVDVSRLIAETIDSIAPPPSFAIEIVSPLPTIQAKRILLSQVFANLLSNAIKHHHRADGRIEISATDLGDCYQFSIADDGPGIPVGQARERIFEIFQTLKPSSSTDNTGIGLALVKKIIEGEGGRIWLTTDRAVGACFCFTWLKTVKS